MKLLLDMNLAPSWVGFLQEGGLEMEWARRHNYVLFTHDLDFSALLAATEARGPSVLQVRTQDVLPDAIGRDVVRVLRMRAVALEQGAIVSVDKVASRVRVLPIRRPSGESEQRG